MSVRKHSLVFRSWRPSLAPLRHDGGGMLYSFKDGYVGSAPAEIGRRPRVREGIFDLRYGRVGIALEEFGSLDHHAVLAKAALRSLLFDPSLLDRMQDVLRLLRCDAFLLCPSGGKTFERGDFLVGYARDRRNARARFLAVNQNGAGSALGKSAAELRADQFEIVAQDIEQRRVVGRLALAPDSIDVERDHTEPPSASLNHCVKNSRPTRF